MSSKYSKYELQSPEWLNEVFFEKILKDFLQDNSIKVISLTIAPATLTNDHYGSVMFRTTIDYSDSKDNKLSVPYIVKIAPEMESVKKDMLGDSFVFKTEIRMYTETIPKMENVLRKYGDNTILGPKLVYSAMEPNKIIVLEDLTKQGFASLDKKSPNYEQIKRAMSKIAKWHAVSYKLAHEVGDSDNKLSLTGGCGNIDLLIEKNYTEVLGGIELDLCKEPVSITTYNDGNFNLEMEKIDFFASGIRSFIKNILSADEELKEYIPYFEEIDKTFIPECSHMGNAYKLGDKALFVLNHGDFHFKNMMFRHKESGELDEIMLIDFQMCYYGPAVMDLTYALYMLLDCETRWNKREEVIYEYFSVFKKTLTKIEFKGEIPKMVDLQIDFIKYQKLETILVAIFLPLVLAFNDEDLEIDKIMESPEFRTTLYQHPRVLQEVKRILPKLLYKGALE